MSAERIVYVNGDYLGEKEAKISIFDRGFLFGDGIYEVTAILDFKLIDFCKHTSRLKSSLKKIEIKAQLNEKVILDIHKQLINFNNLSEGIIYFQVTRGSADRDFSFPKNTTPNVIAFTQKKVIIDNPLAKTGVKVITQPDNRWKRRDIKSILLLAQSMAKEEAVRKNAFESWMIEDGLVTEGTSSSSFIITKNSEIVTRPANQSILAGITRSSIIKLANKEGLEVVERAFSIEEAKNCDEAFLTSTSAFVLPIISIDGAKIKNGVPGPKTLKLRKIYIEEAKKQAQE